MFLFTKVYDELSLRIQQSLRRCNNRNAFQAHAGSSAHQEAARLASEMRNETLTNTLSDPCFYIAER